ncbi:dTDP-4-dehydrorhamnose reductase [compost metagenome]
MQYRDLGSLHWGTYHFSGTPACTWHEFALEIFRQGHQHGLITKIPQVRGIDSAEYPTPAKRPAWSVMDCSKLREQLGISQPDWRLELAAVITELAQSEIA